MKPESDRYKYAKPSKDLILKKKSWDGVMLELRSKSKASQALMEKYVNLYFSTYHEYHPSPFIYDRPVTGPDFLNRQKEKEWALNEIQNHSLVLLYGASGFGRTSVALALNEELKKDNELVVGYVSFREATTEWDLVKRYVEAMFRAMGIPDYRWGLINESNFNTQFLIDFYEKPTEYAKRLGKKLIAIVDDFEAVYALPHADVIESRFRGTWQPDALNQNHISAIVFQNINNDTLTLWARRRALAATGTMLFFERISPELWIADIKKKFASGNKSVDEPVIVYLIEKMNHIPLRIQSLCHHLFLTKSKVLTRQLIDKTINEILENVSWLYEARLGLLSKLQQATLFSYVDKTELKIPPLQHSKIFLSMDEFVFYSESKRVFRDPLLEAYILKRNKG